MAGLYASVNTPIGQSLCSTRGLATLLMVFAFIVVAIDLWFAANRYPVWIRGILPAMVLAFYAASGNADRASLGLRIAPIQPARYWIRITIVVAVLMLIPILAFTAVAKSLSWGFTIPQIPPDRAVIRFLHMCIIAPVIEESMYRLVICSPSVATIGSTGCIVISGAMFAGLHFAYGNPSPDNFLAGYVLAWAYLKSGSIMVPIVWHSLGNSVAFAAQLTAWYAA